MSKKVKFAVSIVLVMTLLFSLIGCSSGGANNASSGDVKPIRIKLGHTLTETSSWQVAAKHFKEVVEEKTGGRYIVDIFPNEQLSAGNQQKALEMVRAGSYEVDIKSSIIWAGLDPQITIANMPWILPSFEKAEEVLQGKGGELLMGILEKNGVVPVAIGETGFRHMLNNVRQIKSPADLKGLKIRVPGMKMYVDLYTVLGADPTVMNFSEVFTALQQGTVDGIEGVHDVMVSSRFHEVTKYLSVNNYTYDFFFFTFSKKFYDSLSDEDKQIFMEAGKEATKVASDYAREKNVEALEFLKTELEVYELTPEEIQVFYEASKPVYDMYKDSFSAELRAAFGYPE